MAEMHQAFWTQEMPAYEGQRVSVQVKFIDAPMDVDLAYQLTSLIQDTINNWNGDMTYDR